LLPKTPKPQLSTADFLYKIEINDFSADTFFSFHGIAVHMRSK